MTRFTALIARDWISAVGAKTAYIEPKSPWENSNCESFNVRFGDEMLNGKVFHSLREAQILIEQWRKHYRNAPTAHWAIARRRRKPSSRWTKGR